MLKESQIIIDCVFFYFYLSKVSIYFKNFTHIEILQKNAKVDNIKRHDQKRRSLFYLLI